MELKTEHEHQVALFSWAKTVPELDMMFAIPNGARTAMSTARKLKAEGLKKGIPDICVPLAKKGHHGLYIELKTNKGKASEHQKEMIEKLNRNGYLALVCYGYQEAIQTIKDYIA